MADAVIPAAEAVVLGEKARLHALPEAVAHRRLSITVDLIACAWLWWGNQSSMDKVMWLMLALALAVEVWRLVA